MALYFEHHAPEMAGVRWADLEECCRMDRRVSCAFVSSLAESRESEFGLVL
jgi:hypothetical protein